MSFRSTLISCLLRKDSVRRLAPYTWASVGLDINTPDTPVLCPGSAYFKSTRSLYGSVAPAEASASVASSQGPIPISKLLVANRGEIACRVITSARRLGIPTVTVFSEADRAALHARMADEAFCIGPAAARDSYLRMDRILDVRFWPMHGLVHQLWPIICRHAPWCFAFRSIILHCDVSLCQPAHLS